MSVEPLDFLDRCDVIDWDAAPVRELANQIAAGRSDDVEIARDCFEWVRDQVAHSGDAQRNPVTCAASDVLHHRTGYCYAKSHLLCALLRANRIPAALCYQRLSIDDNGPPFCLHGLIAVHLRPFGWYRADPRGNRPGVDAQFSPPTEQLAFHPTVTGECNLPDLFVAPLSQITDCLRRYDQWDEVAANLPDVPESMRTAD